MKGINVHLMERKGKCCDCGYVIEKGQNSIVLEEYNNKYRYCRPCFIDGIEKKLSLTIMWSDKL